MLRAAHIAFDAHLYAQAPLAASAHLRVGMPMPMSVAMAMAVAVTVRMEVEVLRVVAAFACGLAQHGGRATGPATLTCAQVARKRLHTESHTQVIT